MVVMVSGITRREFGIFAGSLAIAPFLSETASAQITYEQALKGDEAVRKKFLENLLINEFKILAEPKKDAEGRASALHYISDKPNKKKDEELIVKIRDAYRPIGMDDKAEYFLSEIKKTLIPEELISCIRTQSGVPGDGTQKFFFISGDAAFRQEYNSDDFKSICDYMQEYLKIWTKNITVNNQPYNSKNMLLHTCISDVFGLLPLGVQLGNMLAGIRKPWQNRIDNVRKDYLIKYTNCKKTCNEIAKWHNEKVRDEGIDTIQGIIKIADERMSSLKDMTNKPRGYEHKENENTHTYDLVRIIK